jgi:DMSO/TMAO reductase YedYZ heme-binding membrane subunit
MAKAPEKSHDVFRIVAFTLLGLGVVAAIVCVACVLNYLALERGPSDGFLTMFALDAAHDRAVASGVIAVLLLAAGGVLAVVSRKRRKEHGGSAV